MGRNRTEEILMNGIASSLGLNSKEVMRAVYSFFDSIALESDSLPFNTHRRIYSKDVFDSFVTVRNIPSIGRIGPVYSRYLQWRANESPSVTMVSRSSFKRRVTYNIEDIAADILSGRTPFIKKTERKEKFDRIWLVGQDGKKSARQVILKKK